MFRSHVTGLQCYRGVTNPGGVLAWGLLPGARYTISKQYTRERQGNAYISLVLLCRETRVQKYMEEAQASSAVD